FPNRNINIFHQNSECIDELVKEKLKVNQLTFQTVKLKINTTTKQTFPGKELSLSDFLHYTEWNALNLIILTSYASDSDLLEEDQLSKFISLINYRATQLFFIDHTILWQAGETDNQNLLSSDVFKKLKYKLELKIERNN